MDRDDDKVFGLKPQLPRKKRRPTSRRMGPLKPDDPFPNERDIAAIRGEIIDMAKRCGYRHERIDQWPQKDDYESLLFMERWEAHRVAEETRLDVEACWSRRKMRPWQEVEFINGLRVTNAENLKGAEMVLSGTINKEIIANLNTCGGKAVGVSGKDGHLIEAHKQQH